MNVQLAPNAFGRAAKTRSPRDVVFAADLMDQVVAGILWMSLDLPEDVSRQEMESLAHQMVLHVKACRDCAALEREIAALQLEQFCRSPNHAVLRDVASRIVDAVGAA